MPIIFGNCEQLKQKLASEEELSHILELLDFDNFFNVLFGRGRLFTDRIGL